MAATRTPAKKTTPAKRVVVKPSAKNGASKEITLHAYVPDPAIAARYKGRKIWGVWDAIIAERALEDARNILLDGPTGAGKTLFGEALASKLRVNYYSLPCDVSLDPSALTGRMQPTQKAGVFKFQDGPVAQIFRHGGILNISEVNFMTPKIAASLYPALDGRRYLPLLGNEGEVLRAHRGGGRTGGKCWCSLTKKDCDSKRVLIIADMNGGYRGTMELNPAFKNRFSLKIPWNYEKSVEEQLVHFPTLREIGWKLRDMDDVDTPVSTNMLMEFEEFALDQDFGLEFATQNFLSAFLPEEASAIARAFELDEDNLKKDMRHFKRVGVKISDDDEGEEIEWEQEEV